MKSRSGQTFFAYCCMCDTRHEIHRLARNAMTLESSLFLSRSIVYRVRALNRAACASCQLSWFHHWALRAALYRVDRVGFRVE